MRGGGVALSNLASKPTSCQEENGISDRQRTRAKGEEKRFATLGPWQYPESAAFAEVMSCSKLAITSR